MSGRRSLYPSRLSGSIRRWSFLLTARLFVVVAAFALLVAPAIAQSDRDELSLYRAGRWFELRTIVTARSPALIQGAVAAAFNDRARAERLLRAVIRSQPRPVRNVWSAADCQTALPRGTVRANVSGLFVKRSPLRATMESRAGPSSLDRRSYDRPFCGPGFGPAGGLFDHR